MMLRVAIAQMNAVVGDLRGNRERMLDFAVRAREAAADIVVFPELAVSGYPPEDLLHKDHFVRDNLKSLRLLAKGISGIVAVAGFVDRDAKKQLYNAAAVISGRTIKGVYHKQALPNYGVFDEKRYFTPGTKNPLFSLRGVTFGVSICEDFWGDGKVPLFQSGKGAQVLINIASSPYDFGKLEQREKILKARARETEAFVCYANMVGGQDELVFDGGSLVLDPRGRTLASGLAFAEDLVLVDLPVKEKGKRRAGGRKNLIVLKPSPAGTRAPLPKHLADKGGHIERIYQALVLGTRDYIRKNGFQKVVIGLSGGIDSSLVAVIARAAVGKENVIGVSMPSPYSSPETMDDARQLARNLGIRFIEVPITGIFQAYQQGLRDEFQGQLPDATEENLQARIRGNLLMALSNKFGWLVLTTGNKSEVAVGYCTLYGDMTGGFAVIKDVPKTLVYEIARFSNTEQGPVIPETVLRRAPTAELRENQKDQDTLPPYEVLDALIRAYVEEHRSLNAMAAQSGCADLVKRIIQMVDRSEYKRRQAPPGIKITPRAFGKDWRLPITNKYREF